MNDKAIEELIERYFEGATTLSEEKALHRFFKQKDLPGRYQAEKAMFDYFAAEKAKKTVRKINIPRMVLRWSAVAAVLVLAVFLFFQKPTQKDLISGGSYVIVNGVVSSDPQMVQDEALKALENVSSSGRESRESTSGDDAEKLMLEQLNQFGR
jgi:hypothetical protein